MKLKIKLGLLITFLFLILLPTTALAQGLSRVLPDQFVFGDNYILKSGETLDGNLWVFGGNATIEDGARVTGDARIMGGNLHVDGTIDGKISATGGLVELGKTAIIHGDVDMTGTSLNRDNGAQIDGKVNNQSSNPFLFTLPGGPRVPNVEIHFNPFVQVFSTLLRVFGMAALAVLAVMFWPKQSEHAAQAIIRQPVMAGLLGLLTLVVAPIVLVILVITIIGIPVSFLAALALGIMLLFGWISLGFEVGQRLADAFRQEWALPVSAGIGTLLLTLVAAIVGQIPCVGWVFPTALAMIGLGSILLTRFGTQPYPPYAVTYPAPPSPVAPTSMGMGMPPAPPAPVAPIQPVEREGGAEIFPAPDRQEPPSE